MPFPLRVRACLSWQMLRLLSSGARTSTFALRRTFGAAAPSAAASKFKPDVQPSAEDAAVGAEADELHGSAFDDGVLVGPFGTKSNPVIVKTVFSERVVGCPGECKEDVVEGLRWWVMKVNEEYECPECGQWFKLIKDEARLKAAAEHAHH